MPNQPLVNEVSSAILEQNPEGAPFTSQRLVAFLNENPARWSLLLKLVEDHYDPLEYKDSVKTIVAEAHKRGIQCFSDIQCKVLLKSLIRQEVIEDRRTAISNRQLKVLLPIQEKAAKYLEKSLDSDNPDDLVHMRATAVEKISKVIDNTLERGLPKEVHITHKSQVEVGTYTPEELIEIQRELDGDAAVPAQGEVPLHA